MTPGLEPELIGAELGQVEIGQAEQAHRRCDFWWWDTCDDDRHGATGPQGPPGPTGPAGPRGATGPQGPQGPQGAQGPQGPQGQRGDRGERGEQGPQGPQGIQGPQGQPGAQGAQGPAGPAGPAGARGATGATGAPGATGAVGATGASGATGATGAPGATGATGEAGPAGATGATGLAGATGATGEAGPAGATGATGAPGADGLAGATGATGARGPAGPEGPMGPEGPEGPEGPPGIVESFYTSVEGDQGIAASTMQPPGTYAQTPFPATLTVTVEAGTYLLTWHAEVMRTNQSSTPFYVRLREGAALDNDGGVTYGYLRQRSAVENGPAGNIPDDNEPSAVGDVIPFSGSAVLSLPAGPRSFRLEYAIAVTTTSAMTFVRAQHQRISLMRLE